MKLLIFSILMSLTISTIILCDAQNVTVNVYDYVSLPKKLRIELKCISNTTERSQMERSYKIFIGNRNSRRSLLSFYAFQSAAIVLGGTTPKSYPQFANTTDLQYFMHGIKNEVKLPDDLKSSKKLFDLMFVKKYRYNVTVRRTKEMRGYFYKIYAFLFRCTNHSYQTVLKPFDIKTALVIRGQLFALHKCADKDEDTKKQILKKFASSIARVDQTIKAFDDFFSVIYRDKIERRWELIKLKRREVYFAEMLYDLGMLQAWNFTTTDLEHVRILQKILDPNFATVSAAPYKFVNDVGVTIKGILPYDLSFINSINHTDIKF